MPSIPASVDTAPAAPALSLHGVSVTFDTPQGAVHAVEEVTLSVAAGECLGVVGESGAGKSQLFLAVLGLLAANGRVEGSARLGALELLGLPTAALDRVRGAKIGMVFQDPMTSLTPHLTVGEQLIEVLYRHGGLARVAARRRAQSLLERVHVSDAARRLAQYPHELSGGMRQRAMIAIALAGEPQILIADEPTTSLDVTIQAQILALLAELKRTWASCSSPTTWRPSPVSPTASRCCARAGSSRAARSQRSSKPRATPTPAHWSQMRWPGRARCLRPRSHRTWRRVLRPYRPSR